MKKTYSQPKEAVTREWHIIDASSQIVGRVATQIATKLIGKHKPTFTSHIDGGDYVVVLNAGKSKLSRNKAATKTYYSHSLQPGGFKEKKFEDVLVSNPERIIREAVFSMLPKNRLRTGRMNRLKIFTGTEHPYAQHLLKE
ncbi:50S ribosomal protein L13 [Candidatus Woesebacteria bacterium]|nr:50S ribosomal protein L13 [Candidatus Woesebacteria bacterium]